jgi:hypothetical protein
MSTRAFSLRGRRASGRWHPLNNHKAGGSVQDARSFGNICAANAYVYDPEKDWEGFYGLLKRLRQPPGAVPAVPASTIDLSLSMNDARGLHQICERITNDRDSSRCIYC